MNIAVHSVVTIHELLVRYIVLLSWITWSPDSLISPAITSERNISKKSRYSILPRYHTNRSSKTTREQKRIPTCRNCLSLMICFCFSFVDFTDYCCAILLRIKYPPAIARLRSVMINHEGLYPTRVELLFKAPPLTRGATAVSVTVPLTYADHDWKYE